MPIPVDQFHRLAATAERAGVSKLALASLVADEDPARSALAAGILDAVGQPQATTAQTFESRLFADAAPIDAWNAADTFGVDIAAWQAALSGPASDVQPGMASNGMQIATGETWTWPEPEPPRPLAAPGMTFSASRLNSYAKCPRRWFFEYLCDAVDDPGSVHATYGKVFHEALEALHRDVRVPSEYTESEILRRLLFELTAAFDRAHADFASELEYEVSRLKARSVAEHYARWLVQEAQDQPMRIEEVEALQKWSAGGHSFVGYVDRIDRPLGGGPITVFDYKTGRIEADPQEYIQAVRAGREAQLALYYNVRRAAGDEIARLALVSLRDPRDRAWVLAIDVADEKGKPLVDRAARPGVLRAACTPAQLEEAMAALLERCDLLTRRGLEVFEPGDDPPCSFCAYARACRTKPTQAERVFAR